MRTACLLLALFFPILRADEWGSPVNGLRLALAIEQESVIVTFQNIQPTREMFLPLGRTVGIGRAEFLTLEIVQPDGTRQYLEYTGGAGVAPGRLLPFVVPMMPGSIYTVRTPLQFWRLGSDLRRIEPDLRKGAALQAVLAASESLQSQYVSCYGLQIFWSGRAASPLYRPK